MSIYDNGGFTAFIDIFQRPAIFSSFATTCAITTTSGGGTTTTTGNIKPVLLPRTRHHLPGRLVFLLVCRRGQTIILSR
jgi:hypothetical protein